MWRLAPVQHAQRHSLGQMVGGNDRCVIKIGNGARHAQHPRAGPGRKRKPVDGGLHKRVAFGIEGAVFVEQRAGKFRIAAWPLAAVPLALHGPRLEHALAHLCRAYAVARTAKIGVGHGRNLHMHVYAVEHGARKARLVAHPLVVAAGALMRGVAVIAAGAGIHGGHQHACGGKAHTVGSTRNGGHAALKGLAQGLKGGFAKFGQFVQKQHAPVGKAHLAGARVSAAAYERHV